MSPHEYSLKIWTKRCCNDGFHCLVKNFIAMLLRQRFYILRHTHHCTATGLNFVAWALERYERVALFLRLSVSCDLPRVRGWFPSRKFEKCQFSWSANEVIFAIWWTVSMMATKRMKTLICLLLYSIGAVQCFNIDLSTHVEYRRPASTLFGFSVAAHKEANTGW